MAKTTYNLSKFCELISHDPNTKKFVGLHKKWLGALSQRQDLMTVGSYIDEVLRIDAARNADTAGLFGGSLAMSALVMYSRATTSASPRSRIVVKDVLPDQLLTKHKHLIDVRNEVMAHFNGMTSAGGFEWVEEIGYLREEDGSEPAAGIAFKRANYLAQEINDLREILNFLGPVFYTDIQKRKSAMLAELQQLRNDEEIEQMLQDSGFDLDAWLEREPNTGGSRIDFVRKRSS
ncbi:hypothetical protein AB9E09_03210 [Rhizobium leguminosarum]|uniref:hypothetical protein n=1 Tax=Rhizobium leguminosarum TaxID=384 RepID=UPI003F95A7EA